MPQVDNQGNRGKQKYEQDHPTQGQDFDIFAAFSWERHPTTSQLDLNPEKNELIVKQ